MSHQAQGRARVSRVAVILLIVGIVAIIVAGVVVTVKFTGAATHKTATTGQALQTITTPCYSFVGPGSYRNDSPPSSVQACQTALNLWGIVQKDGTIKLTTAGDILGGVNVRSVTVAYAQSVDPSGTVSGMVSALNKAYIPALGTVISQSAVTVDGTSANLSMITSKSSLIKTEGLLVLKAPRPVTLARQSAQYFLVSFAIPQGNGKAIIARAMTSWRWK
jgi:hypothetical protein